jgi:hypothetical protein
MTNHSLQDCNMLEGASNFVPWKCRLQNLLEELELWYLMGQEVVLPIDTEDLVEHNRKSIEEK